MTIVAGVSSTFDAVVLADSRLSVLDDLGNPVVLRDVCQKLVVANGWSLVGFAGHLCLARYLMNGIAKRLRDESPSTPDWLKDDDQLLEFVASGIFEHVRKVADHKPCLREPVELLIVWMDYTQSIMPGGHKPGDEGFVPGTELIAIRTPEMKIRRTRWGVDVIGSGSVIAPQMRDEAMMKIVNFARGSAYGYAHRCLFTAMVVRTLLSDIGVPTVGGLYQLASLSQKGVELVPYFYWVPVESGFGTYVAMRIEDGYWVQEHRPTKKRIRVMSPFEIRLRGTQWKPGSHEMFDPAKSLTRHSPGVLPATNPLLEWHLYDPTKVPDEIRASWGDDPPHPLTFAQTPRRRKGSKLLFPKTRRRKGES